MKIQFLLFLFVSTLGSCTLMRKASERFDEDINSQLSCLDETYREDLILANQVGKMYLIDSLSSNQIVVYITWENGFISTGVIKDGHPFGKWCCFDQKSRLRRYIHFGYEGKFILSYVEFDKRGNVVKRDYASVPFN